MTTQTPTYDQAKAARTGRVIGGGIIATVGAVIALGAGGVLALGGSDGGSVAAVVKAVRSGSISKPALRSSVRRTLELRASLR